ncbi:MAG: hypothetical protein U0V02_04225 [Anaerolineales bacterium]
MIQKIKRTLLPLFLMVALSACNMPEVAVVPQGGEDASLLLTITAQALILEQARWTATPTAVPNQVVVVVTATADGAATATPDAALPPGPVNAAPPSGATTVTVSIATNCRTGPGQAYPSIFGLPVGQTAEVVGKNTSTNYWIIKIPNGAGTCWLWGQYATVTGDTSALPTVAIPPTPTPTITPTPKVTVTPTSTTALAPAAPSNASAVLLTCVTNNFVQTFTATFTWTDNSSNETGFNIYVNGNFADGSSKDILQVSVGPNTTSYSINAQSVSKIPPIIKVEAFNNTGSSARVSASPLNLSSCP